MLKHSPRPNSCTVNCFIWKSIWKIFLRSDPNLKIFRRFVSVKNKYVMLCETIIQIRICDTCVRVCDTNCAFGIFWLFFFLRLNGLSYFFDQINRISIVWPNQIIDREYSKWTWTLPDISMAINLSQISIDKSQQNVLRALEKCANGEIQMNSSCEISPQRRWSSWAHDDFLV